MQPIGADTPAEYMNAVIDLIETQAYFAKKITNWDTIRQQARIMTGHARTIDETYPAIQMVLERMQHRHSYLIPAETFQRVHGQVNNATYGFSVLRDQRQIVQVLPGSPADNAEIAVGDEIIAIDDQLLKPTDPIPDFDQMQRTIKLTLAHPAHEDRLYAVLTPRVMVRDALPQGRRIDDWGYLELPGLYDEPNNEMYIRVGRDTIHSVSGGAKVKGWVIDVRRNKGGNLWAMLTAIGTLLGDRHAGKFVYRDKREAVWQYQNGATLLDGVLQASLPLEDDEPDYSDVPIAILHSQMTAASGEIVVIAFKGRDKIRTFGRTTNGIPTLNVEFPLSDGARLMLTTAVCADRTGQLYLDSLHPDEELATEWSGFGSDSDPVIEAALDWLQSQSPPAL